MASGIAARQVGPAASLQEEGVAGDEHPVHQEALAAWRVPRGVQQLDLDGADRHPVPAVVGDHVAGFETGHPGDQGGFLAGGRGPARPARVSSSASPSIR